MAGANFGYKVSDLLLKLKISFFGGKPTEYDVVRQNWNDTYINRHY